MSALGLILWLWHLPKVVTALIAGSVTGGIVGLILDAGSAGYTTIGLAIVGSGVFTGVVLKLLDRFLNKRDAQAAERRAQHQTFGTTSVEMARLDLERDKEEAEEARRMREEERHFYTGQLAIKEARIMELERKETVAQLRGHAIGNENTRLQNVAFKLLRAGERANVEMPEVVIINDELVEYLAKLEGMPKPPKVKE